MCTSLTYEAKNHTFFLARTMDFGVKLEGRPVAIPRNYVWERQNGKEIKTRYGFVGTGRKLDGYFFADGVNEFGLSVAELYHPNEATYHDSKKPGKLNLAPHEFIMWVMGENKSIAEIKENIGGVRLINKKVSLLDDVPPLHYIITDSTGESIVIETEDKELVIKENPVGVMTNSPKFEWHLTNLNNFLSLKPTNVKNRQVGELTLHPFGQGSGTFGLPGGFTSPERFVRTVYMKHLIKQAADSTEAVNTILKILNGVTIPKGVNIKDDGLDDYTQYRAVMDASNKIYYFNPYDTNSIFAVKLTEGLLNAVEPTEFLFEEELQIQFMNC